MGPCTSPLKFLLMNYCWIRIGVNQIVICRYVCVNMLLMVHNIINMKIYMSIVKRFAINDERV